jgi:hypothetical protein
MSFDDYLAGQYNLDIHDILSIEQILIDVGNTYSVSFDASKHCWPYELRSEDQQAAGKKSHGTTAMILSALGKLCSRCTLRDGSQSDKLINEKDKLYKLFEHAAKAFSEELGKADRVESGTFGHNDPLTISHITEFARTYSSSGATFEIPSTAIERIKNLVSADPSVEHDFHILLRSSKGNAQGEWCPGSGFVALRIVRAAADLNERSVYRNEAYKTFFETRLHEQLSFSAIPDSRFDPA